MASGAIGKAVAPGQWWAH